jgi:drug/metabolite transporter (DMT)-like permease
VASAAAWGTGDFAGGVASRRAPAVLVVLVSQVVGLGLAVVFALVTAQTFPGPESIAWAAVAGVFGVVGLTAFYQALALGRMGIVAPVAGVLGASIPVLTGVVTQGLPSALQGVGIVLAVASVALVSRPGDEPSGPSDRRALALAIAAGVGFGLFITSMQRAGDASIPWLVSTSRAASLVSILVVIAVSRPRLPAGDRRWLGLSAVTGVFDVVGNGLFVASAQTGRLAIAAVTSSLYPVTTVILARAVLGERFARVHAAGIVVALVAIACIAAG